MIETAARGWVRFSEIGSDWIRIELTFRRLTLCWLKHKQKKIVLIFPFIVKGNCRLQTVLAASLNFSVDFKINIGIFLIKKFNFALCQSKVIISCKAYWVADWTLIFCVLFVNCTPHLASSFVVGCWNKQYASQIILIITYKVVHFVHNWILKDVKNDLFILYWFFFKLNFPLL